MKAAIFAAGVMTFVTQSGCKRGHDSGIPVATSEPVSIASKEEVTPATPPPTLDNTVDSIHGFRGFMLGATRQSLEPRLLPFRSIGSYDHVENTTRTVSSLTGDEIQWADAQVKRVFLQFDSERVRLIRVGIASADFSVFYRAFEMKFGKPTLSSLLSSDWKGKDTRISLEFDEGYLDYANLESKYKSVTIMSNTSDQLCREASIEQRNRERTVIDEKARKAVKDF